MRVLHVYSGNLYGGIETLLATLARRDGEADMAQSFALCFDGRLAGELRAAGADVLLLGEVRASRPQSVRRARRALRELLASKRFDRVICHAAWSQALFGGVVQSVDVPLVFWAHDALGTGHWTEKWARRIAPEAVLCNSAFTKSSVSAFYPGTPAYLVRYPVDVDQPGLTDEERAAVRSECATSGDATVIVQASRMEPWKGHTATLDALSRLGVKDDWCWWIVGGAQRPAEAAYQESLGETARRLGVAERVRFLGDRRDVRRLLAAADIHCQVNLRPEPFGIAYIEALAAGLPVIAADAGGAAEIVDRTCGVLAPVGDVDAVAAALDRLIADRPLRARLAAAAPGRARELCEPRRQIRRLADVLAP
jgi:glycosyltransferase involved in cell wall biosynthesis